MTADASKNGGKTRGRPFEKGNPGGPGRPQGSRNSATITQAEPPAAKEPEILTVEAAIKLRDEADGLLSHDKSAVSQRF